jgi:hypothetical protein
MHTGVSSSTQIESTSIVRGKNTVPAWRIAAGQLTILSSALNGNSTTRAMRSNKGR